MIRPHLLLPIILILLILPQSASFSLGSCSAFSLDGSRCQQCISNYHLYDGKCYVDILGCKTYNFGNICLECLNDYIMVNNYCCDRTCISQMYRQQDPHLGVSQVIQQSQVLQNLLQYVSTNYFTPLQIQVRLTGISFQKYQDVTRFFLLYELLSGSVTYKRLVYDYQTSSNSFILVDDSNLASQLDFQLISFTKITSLLETQKILAQFPTLYTKVNASMTLIKVSKLNRVKQYEIIVHNQNSFKSFYLYNGKLITLYDVILSPEYFKIFIFGAYADRALTQFKFLSDCKALIDKNSSYVNSTITSFEIFNSSLSSEPMKVLVYLENSTLIMKSTFEIYLSSLNVVSNVTLISAVSESKITTALVLWSVYFERQNSDINKVLGLIFSGFNSTSDIPSAYKNDPTMRSDIQWELKLEQWKVFTKYHLHITTKDSVIETTVVRFDFTNEYRINTFVKIQNLTQSILKTVNTLATNFTTDDTSFAPYERTIQSWPQISKTMLQRKNINDIVAYFTQLTQYKQMGSTANITRLVQARNDTNISYTFACQNNTHYMRTSLVNITLNGSIIVLSVEYTTKVFENVFNQMTGSPFYKNDSSKGVQTYYAGLNMFVLYTMFNASNPFAQNMTNTLMDVYSKYKADPQSVKNRWDNNEHVKGPLNGKTKLIGQLMAFYACPTIPMVEYRLRVDYNPGTNDYFCLFLYYMEVTENGVKKFVVTGTEQLGMDWCKRLPGYWSTHYTKQKPNQYQLQATSSYFGTPGNINVGYNQISVSQFKRYFQMNFTYLNNAFNSYANSKFSYEARLRFNTFKLQRMGQRSSFYPQTPYIRWMQLRTDPEDNSTYLLVSYLPSPYYTTKSMPTYSGNFARQYHHLCPALDNRTYSDNQNFYILGSDKFWLRPNVTDWYASVVGKDLLFNTAFVKNVTSPADQSIYNSSLFLIKTALKTTTDFTLYPVWSSLKINFKAYQLYMQRLNSSTTTVLDYMSILDLTTKRLEIVSTLPFFRQFLETFSLTKSQQFTQIMNLSYINSTIGVDFQQYLSPLVPQIDQKINDLMSPHIMKFLSLSTLANPTFQISFRKVYFSSENLTNQSAIVTYVVEISNLTLTSAIYGQNSTLVKSYVSVPVLIRYTTVKNSSTNVINGDFSVYILQVNNIASNSSIGGFVIKSTVEDKVELKETVANYTVNYNFNYYSQGVPPLISGNTNTANNSYINVVNYGANISQGTTKFNSLTSEQGRVLEDGEIVEIKYFPEERIMKSNLTEFADYSKVYNESVNRILEMIQTKFRQRLTMPNLTITVLMVEKLTDQRGFRQYHMLLRVNVTYSSLSSLKQQNVIHVLRSTYLTYLQFFTSMGSQFLGIPSYESVLSDIKAEPNLYFQPLVKVSNLQYMQSFLLETLNLINRYIMGTGSGERAIVVNGVYFRNFVQGGFYKVYVELRSGNVGIGYMLERDYDYSILEVEIMQVPRVVPNDTTVTTANSTTVTNANNTTVTTDQSGNSSNGMTSGTNDTETSDDSTVSGSSTSNATDTADSTPNTTDTTNGAINSTTSPSDVSVLNNTTTTNTNTSDTTNATNASTSGVTDTASNTTNSTATLNTTNSTNTINTTNTTNTSNNTNTTNTNDANTTTNTTTANTTTNTPTVTPSPTSPQPSLEQVIFSNITAGSVYEYMQVIIMRLRMQYSSLLQTSLFTSFKIKQSSDGQFYNLSFSQPSAITILKYNIIVYRCNSTCVTFTGSSGSLYLLSFTKSQTYTSNGTIVTTNVTTSSTTTYVTSNSDSDTSTSTTTNGKQTSTISQSFYVSSLNITDSSSYFQMSESQQQSVISIFQSIFNQQNMTTLDTRLIQFQKYLDFLKNYTSLTLETNTSKPITTLTVNSQVRQVLSFVREKYLTFLNNSVVLMIVQNSKLINTTTNLTTNANYALYMLVQSLPLINSTNTTNQWTIYKISINLKELLPLNYQLSILNFTEFAKNNQLSTNMFSFTSPQPSSKQQTDIAFGYAPVNITDSATDPDLVFTLNELKAKYFSLIINKTLTSIHKLQLKNGTLNYKLHYQDLNNGDTLKIVAVYQKEFKLVQVLNKVYMPNQNFRQVTESELASTDIINNTISLISQLHQHEISSPFMTVTNIEVTSQALSSLTPENLRYRIEFISPLGQAFTSIVQYNPTVKSLIQVSFNQKIELPKDSSYRLNSFEQQHALGWLKLQLSEVLNDPFYQIALNKLKANNINYAKTLIVFKKNDGTSVMFKIVYQSKIISVNSTTASILLLETVISVDPMNQLVQVKQPSYQLNFTDGFMTVLQTEIQQQELIELTSSFGLAMNFGLSQPMIIKQNLRKYFIDGLMMKSQVMVRMIDNTTTVYEVLSFRSIYSRQFVIWSISAMSLPKFESCSLAKSCAKCSDSAYKLTGGVCLLSIAGCSEYLIEATTDALKCTTCSLGYQLMDQKCISRQYYPDLFA